MSASVLRGIGVIALSLLGFVSTMLIWMSGSHRYGALSTVWHSVGGIKNLILISLVAYACSAALLVDMRRARASGFHLLLVFSLLAAVPFVFFAVVLTRRFLHGGD